MSTVARCSARLTAIITIVIAVVTLVHRCSITVFVSGVLGVAAWFAIGIAGSLRRPARLVLAPEEAFALKSCG